MSEIPKAYEPQAVEEKWYDLWLKQGCFTADPARVSENIIEASLEALVDSMEFALLKK